MTDKESIQEREKLRQKQQKQLIVLNAVAVCLAVLAMVVGIVQL